MRDFFLQFSSRKRENPQDIWKKSTRFLAHFSRRFYPQDIWKKSTRFLAHISRRFHWQDIWKKSTRFLAHFSRRFHWQDIKKKSTRFLAHFSCVIYIHKCGTYIHKYSEIYRLDIFGQNWLLYFLPINRHILSALPRYVWFLL